MHPSQCPAPIQRRRVGRYVRNADSEELFNLLTGPQLLDRVEALLPEHRERLFPPTETLSMFLAQVLSADGSCRQVVDDAMVKRVLLGLGPGSTDTGGTATKHGVSPPADGLSGWACRCRDCREGPAPDQRKSLGIPPTIRFR